MILNKRTPASFGSRTKVCIVLMFLLTFGILSAGLLVFWSMPYQTSMDCRGSDIDVEWVKQMSEREKNGYKGLLKVTAWSYLETSSLSPVTMPKEVPAIIVGVYGPMELVYPVRLLDGSYGLPAGNNHCVVSRDLAWKLFGSTDIVGQHIKHKKNVLEIIGVIDQPKEKSPALLSGGNGYLLLPMKEGRVEQLEFLFQNRFQVKEKLSQFNHP